MKVWKTLLPVALTALLFACGGGGGNDGPLGVPAVATVAVSPQAPTLTVGDTLQLSVKLSDSNGRNIVGRSVTWSSLSSTTVSVTAGGQITAVAVGQTQVTASVEARQGATTVTVIAPVQQPPASVASVTIEPVSIALNEGSSRQLEAKVRDADGKVLTGRGIQWSTLEPQIAMVDAGGMVTALRTGIATINARVEGKTGAASVRVEADYSFSLLYSSTPVGAATELYTLNIRDPAATAMPVFTGSRSASHPAASPDGKKLAFVVLLNTGSAIFHANADGSAPTRLTPDDYTNDQPAWSPDGLRIAFRRRIPNMGTDIWVMDASDGGNAVNLTASHGATNQSWPAWSPVQPDGSLRIAYSHSEAGNGHLWTMRADGSDKQQVTSSNAAYDDQPSWSPTGDRIVFTRSGTAIFGDLYIVNATGGNGSLLMQLAGPLAGPQFAPAWSPDGRLIAFTSRHEGDYYQVYTVWSDGTRLAQRTSAAANHETPVWLNVVAVQ